jgi:hypothetical protein
MADGTMNSQIVDSVANVVTLASATAPAQAFAMLDAVFAEALGMSMHNAVYRQQSASMIGSAAVTAACARMLGGPLGPIPTPPPPPEPLPPAPPGGVHPLPPVSHLTPMQTIASATVEAEQAIGTIRDAASLSDEAAAAAHDSLAEIAKEASATDPSPPPPDPPSPPTSSSATTNILRTPPLSPH